MSNRPTPETDAAQHEGLLRTNPIPMQIVTANFARKLKRERDEAKEAMRTLAEHGESEIQKLQNALMEIEDRCVDCEDACGDIQKIRDIAVKALEGEK